MFTKNHVFMLMGACVALASCSSGGEQPQVTIETNIDAYDEPTANEQPAPAPTTPAVTVEAVQEPEKEAQPVVEQQTRQKEPQEEIVQVVKETTEATGDYSTDELYELSGKLKVNVEPNDDISLFKEAASWLGTPYLYAGKDKNGIDCSAFIDAIYLDVYGKKLNRRANEIYEQCDRIEKENAKAGDIVFFHSEGKINETPNYAGIYLKDNTFIITTTKRGVMIETLANRYYKNNFVCFGRPR